MTKVLFIAGGLHAGGSENYLLRFIRYCGKDDFDWTVLSVNTEKGDMHDEYVKAGCHVIYQSISYVNVGKFYQFYKLLKKEKYDVLCTLNGNFGGIPLTIARLAGIKKRIAWHRRSTDAFGNNPFKKVYNQFVNQLVRWNATSILSNSNFALKKFYGRYRENDPRFYVLYNGVNKQVVETPLSKDKAREKLNIKKHVFLIGHVGRHNPAKNHEVIFKVAQEFIKTKNVHFLFCGRGTDSEQFKQKVVNCGISEICHCLGLVDHVAWVYKSMDLFFFPSITEGQPNALIEAILAGLPFVSSNIPPVVDMLPKSAMRFTFNPIDSDAFYKKIKMMMRTPPNGQSAELGKWATESFKPSKNFNQFKKILTR